MDVKLVNAGFGGRSHHLDVDQEGAGGPPPVPSLPRPVEISDLGDERTFNALMRNESGSRRAVISFDEMLPGFYMELQEGRWMLVAWMTDEDKRRKLGRG